MTIYEIIIYFLKVNLCLSGFYLFYWLFLRQSTQFRLNRAYLLFTLVLAFVIPLFKLEIKPDNPVSQVTESLPRWTNEQEKQIFSEETRQNLENLPDLQIPENQYFSNWTSTQVFLSIYLIISALLLLRMLWIIGLLGRFIWVSHIQKQNGFYLVLTKGKAPMFSFFNYVFWDNRLQLQNDEKEQILLHELSHVQQKHTFDILLVEILTVLFWFNPIVWFYKKSIQENHEYLADNQVIAERNPQNYARLLLNQAMQSGGFALASYFTKSQIKKRIKMMANNQEPRNEAWRYALAVPLLFLMGLAFSQIYVKNEDSPKEAIKIEQAPAPEANAEPVVAEDKADDWGEKFGLAMASMAIDLATSGELKELILNEIQKEIAAEKQVNNPNEDEFEKAFRLKILNKIQEGVDKLKEDKNAKFNAQELKNLILNEINQELKNQEHLGKSSESQRKLEEKLEKILNIKG